MKTLEQIFEAIDPLPGIQAGKNLWQNEHHQHDVYEHTLAVVDEIQKLTASKKLIASAYLHDIGKPATAKLKIVDGILKEKEPDKPYHTFKLHEEEGEKIVREMPESFFSNLELDQEEVASLVGAHFVPLLWTIRMKREKTYKGFTKVYANLEKDLDSRNASREDILTLFEADNRSKGCGDLSELMEVKYSLLSDTPNLLELYQTLTQMKGGKEK